MSVLANTIVHYKSQKYTDTWFSLHVGLPKTTATNVVFDMFVGYCI